MPGITAIVVDAITRLHATAYIIRWFTLSSGEEEMLHWLWHMTLFYYHIGAYDIRHATHYCNGYLREILMAAKIWRQLLLLSSASHHAGDDCYY